MSETTWVRSWRTPSPGCRWPIAVLMLERECLLRGLAVRWTLTLTLRTYTLPPRWAWSWSWSWQRWSTPRRRA